MGHIHGDFLIAQIFPSDCRTRKAWLIVVCPVCPRLLQLLRQVCQRDGANRLFLDQFPKHPGSHVEDYALMASLEQLLHHVRAHSSKTN